MKRAFSLIELLVALSILAVVAALVVPKFLNVRSQASVVSAQAQQQVIQNAVMQWLALGGTTGGYATGGTNGGPEFDGLSAGSILQFLTTSNGGNARTPFSNNGNVGPLSDSPGTAGSGTIALSFININDPNAGIVSGNGTSGASGPASGIPTKQGFSWQADDYAWYVDPSGTPWYIFINSSTGQTIFYGVSTTMAGGGYPLTGVILK